MAMAHKKALFFSNLEKQLDARFTIKGRFTKEVK